MCSLPFKVLIICLQWPFFTHILINLLIMCSYICSLLINIHCIEKLFESYDTLKSNKLFSKKIWIYFLLCIYFELVETCLYKTTNLNSLWSGGRSYSCLIKVLLIVCGWRMRSCLLRRSTSYNHSWSLLVKKLIVTI